MTGTRGVVRKTSTFSLAVGMVLVGLGILAPRAAQAAAVGFSSSDPNVTITAGGSNCNGVIPPKKSDTDTHKTLIGFDNDPNKPEYAISYPADPSNIGSFSILDCMLTGNAGDELKDMTVVAEATFDKVNNSTTFSLDFTVDLTALNAQVGQQICNVAKTTATPSAGPAGVRKAAAACFVVGGDQRVEKRDVNTGAVVTGGTPATFRVACVNSAADPSLQPVIVNTTNVPTVGSVDLQANVLAFNGPSGSTCTVQEIAAPSGYQMPTAGVCAGAVVPPACDTISVTLGVGATQNVIAFNDTPAAVVPVTRSLTVSKTINGGTGSFGIHAVCDDGSKADYTVTKTETEPALTGIKDGASCTVSEDDPGTGWSTTVNGNNGRSVTLTMDQNRNAAFVNTFTPAARVVEEPTTTTTRPAAEVLAEVVTRPAAAPAVAPAALPRTGRELGLAARVGGVMIALGLMALAASGRKREAASNR